MHFELADYYADEGIGLWVESLRFTISTIEVNDPVTGDKYHEAEISPLVEEISVYIDTVRFAQVLGDYCPDRGKVLFLERMFVLDVSQLDW